jgi:lipopolysaccharide transport system ATP-binding protein
MSSDVLVRVEGVSKKFSRDLKKSLWYGVKDAFSDLAGRDGTTDKLRPSEFWALNNVSFNLRRGECLGLIGRNGAGKTTLLKLLSGLIKPDSGRVEIRGRLGALIALGAGFNPILSGRENIYVNAAVLGLSRCEIDEKFSSIVDFAEIDEFIDAPVQSYSSGMQVRLGFAIATAMEPDVLLLDEVLAVGDTAFQAKCYARISELKNRAAMIFVSHYMSSIARVSNSALLLHNGHVCSMGETSDIIQQYHSVFAAESGSQKLVRSGTGEVKITDAQVKTRQYADKSGEHKLTGLTAVISLVSDIDLDNVIIDLTFRRTDGIAFECPSPLQLEKLPLAKGVETKISLTLEYVPLASGIYGCAISILDSACIRHFAVLHDFQRIVISNDSRFTSAFHMSGSWTVESKVNEELVRM